MNLLVVHPGASTSTADVYNGIVGALYQLGHGVAPFPLDVRLDRADSWLMFSWKRARRADPDVVRPTWPDALYTASKDIVIQALRLRVQGWLDGVLIISGMYVHPDILLYLRAAGVPTAMLLTESPYDQESEAKIVQLVDVAWTNERSSVPYLRERSGNSRVHYLQHAYDPQRHRPDPSWLDETVPAHDVVFVGTAFRERIEFLEQVDWSGIDLGLYGSWDGLPSRHRLRQHVRGKHVDNELASSLYRRARIGLNLYRTSKGFGSNAPRIAHAESLNPRAYELAACGVFQMSDFARAELLEFFGGAAVATSDPIEFGTTVRHFLAHSEDRTAFAENARRAVQGHTFTERVRQMVNQLAHTWALAEAA